MKAAYRVLTILIALSMLLGLLFAPAFSNATALAQTQITETPTDVVPTPTVESNTPPTQSSEIVPLVVPRSGRVVPGQFIVVYKDDNGDVETTVNAAAANVAAAGGNVQFIYKSAIKGFAARLSPEMLDALRQDPRIAYIEADQVVTAIDDSGPSAQDVQAVSGVSWGLDRIDQRNLPLDNQYYYPASAGAGVNVYVLDTGIRLTHVDFGGRASLAYDVIGDSNNGVDCGPSSGHGTHVSGTIGGSTYGVAKAVNLFAVRVLGCDGTGPTSGVIAGVDWVKQNRVSPAVANMSLGGSASIALDSAVKSAIASGVTFVVAAGNDNINACNSSPARVTAAITVGATNNTDTRASFSNFGSCVDIFAPGVQITSDLNTGNSDTATATWDGTSMATPHVTGAVALYLASNPSASPATVASVLFANSTKNVVLNPAGSYNRLLFASAFGTAPVLVAPVANWLTNDSTPAFSWKSVYNADTYDLQVDDNSNFSSPLSEGSAVSGLNYNIVTSLTDGKWYWRVRANNAFGVSGPWSVSRYFTVDTVPPLKPALYLPLSGSSIIGTPTFSWKASATATRYQFEYNTVNDPNSFLYQSGVLSTLSFKPPAMPTMTPFYWFVRARDAAGNWSDWSDPFTVTVVPPVPAAPILVSPASGFQTNDTTVYLSWNPVAYGVDYEVQVDDSATFTLPLTQDAGVSGTYFTTDPLADGKYYWRARALNANSVYGPWSVSRYFTVDTVPPLKPLLYLPLSGSSIIGTPTFSWKASATATRYQFEYNTVNDPNSFLYQSGVLSTLSFKPPAMPTMTPFYWFVRARDAAGNWSDWSDPFTVTVVPPVPAAPILVSPASGFQTDTSTPTVYLSWNSVAYGANYEVQVDDSATFTLPLTLDYTGVAATSRTTDPLAAGKYYWRVRAQNANSVYGPWSVSRYFMVYPAFNTQFNTGGDYEGWEQQTGASWSVSSGSLSTPGLDGWYTSSADYAGANFTDFTYQARMLNSSMDTSYGLVVRGSPTFNIYNDWQNGYYFIIGQFQDPVNGNVACYNVYKITNGVWSSQTTGGYFYCSNTINLNGWNDLKVYAKGSTLKFYINGTLVWSKSVSGPLSGRLGVFTYRDAPGTTYVDWAVAGMPVLSSLNEQVAPGQRPYMPQQGDPLFNRGSSFPLNRR